MALPRLSPGPPIATVALIATLLAGCGGDGGSQTTAPEADPLQSELPPVRKSVIFEPGPVAILNPARDEILDEIAALGVDTVRVVANWSGIAPAEPASGFDPGDPADPGYDFVEIDDFVRAAKARDLRILLTISGPVPLWASRSRSDVADPRPFDFGKFAFAVASRYGGGFDPDGKGAQLPLPAVDLWSVWNEPNLSIFLQPQHRGDQPYSPILYRRLYIAAQQAIAVADTGAPVLIGETAPTGGNDSIDPLPFARRVLCIDQSVADEPTCEQHLVTAGWAIHPYTLPDQAPYEDPPGRGFVTIGNLDRLEALLAEAAEAGTVRRDLPIYLTEFGFQTEPDPLLGIPPDTQAAYLGISEWIAYEHPQVRSYAQYLMRDDPIDRVSGTEYGGFESGLRFSDGRAKPAYEAFRLPLAVRRDGDEVEIWGLVRPARAPTSAVVLVTDGGRAPRVLRRVETSDAGIFNFESDYVQGRLWRLRWTDPDGETFQGPWIPSYAFPDPNSAPPQ